MATEVVMTVWIRPVQGSEKVKDHDVDEAHEKSDGVYFKGGVLHLHITHPGAVLRWGGGNCPQTQALSHQM